MKKRSSRSAAHEFRMNRPVFLSMIGLAVATIAIATYDVTVGERSLLGSQQTYVLAETDSNVPTLTPYLTPTNTPK